MATDLLTGRGRAVLTLGSVDEGRVLGVEAVETLRVLVDKVAVGERQTR